MGKGKVFCAGRDTKVITGSEDERARARARHPWRGGEIRLSQYATRVWSELPVPVIAAVHGVAVGGGLHLMLGADIRLTTPDCRMSFAEVDWGLVPDMGGTEAAFRSIGAQALSELLFTGRTIAGDEAVRLGLVLRTCADPLKAARDMALQIATKSPDAIRAAKALIGRLHVVGVEGALAAESELNAALAAGDNRAELVSAKRQGRSPIFQDPL